MAIHQFNNRINYKYCIVGKIIAKYEINLTCMAFDYPPSFDKRELFNEWARQVRNSYPNGLVDIEWFVHVENVRFKPEFMPRPGRAYDEEDFLKYFTHPFDVDTGEFLNWKDVPVAGGVKGAEFIEELTGWAPTILQLQVSLDWLIEQANKSK